MDFSQLTLGQLLAHQDTTVRRGATQCLKRLTDLKGLQTCEQCGKFYTTAQCNGCNQ